MAANSFPLRFIDHVAFTVIDLDATTEFYHRLFGVEVLRDNKPILRALRLGGSERISLHQQRNGVSLVAGRPTPGAVDICFRIGLPIEAAVRHLWEHDVAIIDRPSPRSDNEGNGAQSIYFRDPDGNLIELMAAPDLVDFATGDSSGTVW
jgi:catechol 2,3-dioxygenase-like lactoylglutathione lyase family enzyme